MSGERHILGVSGGRDSAALAVYMRQHHPELSLEYFFTDTGKELPEVYRFLDKLEGFLGRPIQRLNPDRDFDFWLDEYGGVMTAHGFRSTASTLLNESKRWSPDAIERALAHEDKNAVRAAYNRTDYWDERVEMMQWWSDRLDALKASAM